MIEKYSWLGELMKIAGTDRDAARENIQSVSLIQLSLLFLTLSEPDHQVAPLFLMIVPSPRFEELDRLMDEIVTAARTQVKTAVRRLSEQDLAVRNAFDSAMNAQTNHLPEEESTRDFYFLQIGIRQIRRDRLQYVVARQERVAGLSRIIKSEARRRAA